MKIEELGISPEIAKALKEIGIIEATDIQEKTMPLVKDGQDVVGISKTGSGKTAAFAAPALERITPGKGIQLLVMAPTRELAVQIAGEVKKFGKYLHFNIATIYGGVGMEPQIDALERAEIVVGTPGRLLDHLNRRNLDVSELKIAVLDEADKMVEMGFVEDITLILEKTPENRQMLLFGATISDEILDIKEKFMHNPIEVAVEAQVEDDLLEQYYYNIPQREKFSMLVHLLNKEDIERAIIFCSARSTVELVARNLRDNGIKAELIHGKLSQTKRLRVIDGFNKGKVKFLVASSVAARGLHIEDVTHVFNYDLSQDPQEYIHRVGRTARAGQKGKAITLLSERDYEAFGQIMDRYRVPVMEMPTENFKKLSFNARREERRFGGREHRGFNRPHLGEGRREHQRHTRRSGYESHNNVISNAGWGEQRSTHSVSRRSY